MNRDGRKINANKTLSITIIRSRTLQPSHPCLHISSEQIKNISCILLLGVTYDSKMTFEKHICSMSSTIAKKTGLLRKCFKTLTCYSAVTIFFFMVAFGPILNVMLPLDVSCQLPFKATRQSFELSIQLNIFLRHLFLIFIICVKLVLLTSYLVLFLRIIGIPYAFCLILPGSRGLPLIKTILL